MQFLITGLGKNQSKPDGWPRSSPIGDGDLAAQLPIRRALPQMVFTKPLPRQTFAISGRGGSEDRFAVVWLVPGNLAVRLSSRRALQTNGLYQAITELNICHFRPRTLRGPFCYYLAGPRQSGCLTPKQAGPSQSSL